MGRIFCLILVFLPFYLPLSGQFSGMPQVRSFEKTEYRSGSSNWDIGQDSRGVMYFANNNGLLIFDGFSWSTYRLPNKTTARSVAIDPDGRIYVGGQNEIGYFFPDEKGMLQYHSILEKIDESNRAFTDVWQIEILGDKIFWRSQEKLFLFDQDTVTLLDQYSFQFMAPLGSAMLLQNMVGQLFTYEDGSLDKLSYTDSLLGTLVTELIPLEDGESLLVTEKDGIWLLADTVLTRWNTSLNSRFSEDLIYAGVRLTDGRIALGTTYSGLAILDENGQLLQMLSKEIGVRMNQTICLFEDRAGNLWAGLNNGITLINIHSPFTFYYPDGVLEGVGYQSIKYQGDLYFATGNGLYYMSLDSMHSDAGFQLVEGSIGQCWGLSIANDQLILSHNKGAFLIEDHKARHFFKAHGTWLVQEDRWKPGNRIMGTYYGVYGIPENSADSILRLGGMVESSRFICQEKDGTIWMAHPYRGIYRIQRDGQGGFRHDHFTEEHGLPSRLNNHVFTLKNEILFCAERGIYSFDREKLRFYKDSTWNQLFDPGVKIRRIFEAPNGDIWFVTESEIGYFDVEDTGLKRQFIRHVFPQIYPMLNGGWENIYPMDDRNVFIATSGGFVHFDPSVKDPDSHDFDLLLTEVHVGSKYDRKIFGGYYTDHQSITHKQEKDHILKIPFIDNSIKFHVAATEYKDPESMLFRWKLVGLETQFSNWGELRYKEYTQLEPGPYQLLVECRDANGHIKQLSYRFVLETPWYRSLAFQVIVLIALISALGHYILRSQIKLGEMEEKVEETVKESEAKAALMEQERIMAELDHKRRELVSSTLHLANMQDNFSEIRDRIRQLKVHITNPKAKEEVSRLMRMMDMNEHVEDHWENIMLHFNEVHGDLLNRLKKEYPELSSKDLKLCTYLRMNLSTKEIASLMNVSTRGVEASRYRLRKKIGLEGGDDLVDFLMNY